MTDTDALVLRQTQNGITTLTMNLPKRLNGWTFPMMDALRSRFEDAAADADTQAIVLTGADPYYCAGVNLGGTLRVMHPKQLHETIREHNQSLFELFLDFPKPILIAANGPAIGASVTSATLCDGIVASENATFSTPFARLGVSPEGCSSVLFAKIMGEKSATRMLGPEGWVPTASEAVDIGLVERMVPHDELLDRAQEMAEQWVEHGRQRTFRGGMTREELKAINATESIGVADSFLSAPFLQAQARFLWSRKKRVPAGLFFLLGGTRFLWGKLL